MTITKIYGTLGEILEPLDPETKEITEDIINVIQNTPIKTKMALLLCTFHGFKDDLKSYDADKLPSGLKYLVTNEDLQHHFDRLTTEVYDNFLELKEAKEQQKG